LNTLPPANPKQSNLLNLRQYAKSVKFLANIYLQIIDQLEGFVTFLKKLPNFSLLDLQFHSIRQLNTLAEFSTGSNYASLSYPQDSLG